MVAVEKSSVVNSRFFPRLMGSILFFLSLVMAFENYFQPPAEGPEDSAKDEGREEGPKKKWIQSAGVGIICLLYYFLFQPLGFLLSSSMFMMAFLLFLGTRKWYALLFLSTLVPLSVYTLFKAILGAPLPDGLLYF
jgi:putative tricarboxylic transport membrane protein